MKRRTFLLIFLVIPLLAMAITLPNPFGMHKVISQAMNYPDRAWRISEILQEGYSENTYNPEQKNIYFYNAQHPTAIDSIQTYLYDTGASAWTLSSSLVFSYDAAHEYVNNAIMYVMFGPDTRLPFIRELVDYNSSHYLTRIVVQFSDLQTSGWSDAIRMHMLYNNNDISASINWQSGDTTTPPSYQKRTFNLDAQGRIIQETTQVSPDSTSWVNDEKVIRTYHSNDTTTGATFIYNLAHAYATIAMTDNAPLFGMVLQEIDQSWNNDWVNRERLSYEYNTNNLATFMNDMTWDGAAWVNNARNVYTYDTNNNLYQDVNQGWQSGTSDWNTFSRKTYTWNDVMGNDDETAGPSSNMIVNVYPNPFNNTQHIKVYSRLNQPIQVQIFNVKGQKVHTGSFMPGTNYTWNAENMPSGVYLMKINQGDNAKTSKIMKIK
jgi:hypothetical protein